MFFTDKHKLEVLMMRADVLKLKDEISILNLRMDALLKLYPNGINKDGSPRKKMGRKVKEQA